MFARLVFVTGDPARMQESIRYVEETARPAVSAGRCESTYLQERQPMHKLLPASLALALTTPLGAMADPASLCSYSRA